MSSRDYRPTLDHADRLRNHWWPRPGWRPGRIMCTWHVTFDHARELRELVATYHHALAPLPGLHLVPTRWLHLTIQGVGYLDELPPDQLNAITDAVRVHLADVPAFTLTFHRAVVLGEALALPPEPVDPLHDLLTRIRAGITDATGAEAHTGPEQARGFRPHVTIAYSHTDAAAEPYGQTLDSVSAAPVRATVSHVALIDLDRRLAPDWLYRWTTRAIAPLAK